MKIDHVYVRLDGVICACIVQVPKEPTNVCSTCKGKGWITGGEPIGGKKYLENIY